MSTATAPQPSARQAWDQEIRALQRSGLSFAEAGRKLASERPDLVEAINSESFRARTERANAIHNGPARQAWTNLVDQEYALCGSRRQAITRAVSKYPDAHRAFLREANGQTV